MVKKNMAIHSDSFYIPYLPVVRTKDQAACMQTWIGHFEGHGKKLKAATQRTNNRTIKRRLSSNLLNDIWLHVIHENQRVVK